MSNKQVYRLRQYDNKNQAVTPKQRAFMKKVGNKQLRKQHEQILKEGLLNLEDDLFGRYHYMWEDDDSYEDSYDYYLDQNPEYEIDDDQFDHYYDDYYDDWGYDWDEPSWGDARITHDDISQLAQDKVVIT